MFDTMLGTSWKEAKKEEYGTVSKILYFRASDMLYGVK